MPYFPELVPNYNPELHDITKFKAILFDTETTGFKEPRLIEAAYIPCEIDRNGMLIEGVPFIQRYNPLKPSEYGALKTHHIFDKELEGLDEYTTFSLPSTEYVICQNVAYDMKVIGHPTGYKTIDTVGLLRRLWPDVDSHSLTPMMYAVFGQKESIRNIIRNAHNALADCRMLAYLLQEIIHKAKISDFDHLYRYSEDCKVTTMKMPFGEKKGTYLVDLGLDDLRRLAVNERASDDVREVARKLLA